MTTSIEKEGLRSRVLRGSAWIFSGNVLGQIISLITNLIMTRMLVPEMFGVMALANTFIIGAALFSDLGINQNIIQSKRGDDPNFLNTAWIMQIIRAGILGLLVLTLAATLHFFGPVLFMSDDTAFANPILVPVLLVLALNAFLSGFDSTKLATAGRSLRLYEVVRIELLSQLSGIPVMVTWAYISPTIWALVAGALVATTTRCLLSHLLIPGKTNRLYWDSDAFREIFNFGKWIFLSSILGFFVMHGDKLILGSLIDSKSLGFYAIALTFVHAVNFIILGLMSDVGLPALSEVYRDRPEDLKKIYYKMRLPVDLIVLLASGGLFIFGSTVIEILYDDRYLEAGYILEILAISLIAERYIFTYQYFLAIGKPVYQSLIYVIRTAMLFIATPFAFDLYGEQGAILAIACNGLLSLPFVFYLKYRFGVLSIVRELIVLIAFPVGAFAAVIADKVVNYFI